MKRKLLVIYIIVMSLILAGLLYNIYQRNNRPINNPPSFLVYQVYHKDVS